MPTPTVSPIESDKPTYTISDSTALIAEFTADIDSGEEESVTLTFADQLAGLAFKLFHIDNSATPQRTEVPVPATNLVVGHYTVNVEQSPPANNSVQLTVSIREDGGGVVTGEAWELRASANVQTSWVLARSTGAVEVRWLAVDPVAELTVPTTTDEQTQVKLSATNALFSGGTSGTFAGTLPADLKPVYKFEHNGAIPLTELPHSPDVPSTFIVPPGVYEPVPVPFTVTTEFVDPDDIYSGFLQNTSAAKTMTVNQRPQQIVLVIDRSGSMSLENRYENAKVACRALVNLFHGMREGVNTNDKIGIVAFEDETVGFRSGTPSTRITRLLELTPLPEAVEAINKPAFDFGAPGTNTPIGDGIVEAVDMLANEAPITNQRFTIIVLTDGQQNAGTVTLGDAEGGAKTIVQALSTGNRPPVLKDPGTGEVRCQVFSIALGPTASQALLQALPAKLGIGGDTFALASDASELARKFGKILETAQTVNAPLTQKTPTGGNIDNDAARFPAGANAVYFFSEATADRLVVAVTPPVGSTTFSGTIELARFDGASYVPVKDADGNLILPVESPSDRSISVPQLPSIAQGKEIHWRVIHGAQPTSAQQLDEGRVQAYIDLHLRADVVLDKPSYRTGDRITLTVRIRQDAAQVLGATVKATLDAPSVGLGQELAALGDIKDLDVDAGKQGPDAPTWLERRIGAVLRRHGWRDMPRTEHSEGLFVDGTDQLFDADGDGNYTNTFAKVHKEGTYAFDFAVQGNDVGGNPFSRSLAIATFASIKVDPKKTTVKVTRIHQHPSGKLAARVVITPQDKRQEHLGPGHDAEVVWALDDGVFEHVRAHQPAPVFTDGTYQRVVLYTSHDRPTLLVKAAKVLLKEIDIRRQLLGLDFD